MYLAQHKGAAAQALFKQAVDLFESLDLPQDIDRDAVIQDALRSLLQEKPQIRVELALYRYQTEDISLAKAAHLAGLSFDSFKALLVQRGIQPRLGPADEQDARQEIAALDQILPD